MLIFQDKLGLKKFHLCPIDQAEAGNTVMFEALLLLMTLAEQKASGFQWIITGDESRFFFDYPGDSVWAAWRDEFPQPIK